MRRHLLGLLLITLAVSMVASAQEQKPAEKPGTPLTASGRLMAARTAYLKKGPGSSIPFDFISSAVEGWAHYTLVDSPQKADVVIEVSAPDLEGNGVSVTSSTSSDPTTGRPTQSTSSSRTLSPSQVKMVVYDAKTKFPLWTATENAKFAMKKKNTEDNLYEAAQKLFAKFRDHIENAAAAKPAAK